MGNEQSAPAPRGARNRLSKPRTNSSTNTSNSRNSAPPTRRNSQSNNVGISNNRYSTVSLDVVGAEAGERRWDQPRHRKRMSMFRSKSTQPQVQELRIGSGVNIDSIDKIPVERESKRSSIVEDPRDQWQYNAPVERYFDLRTSQKWRANTVFSADHPIEPRGCHFNMFLMPNTMHDFH